MSENDKPRLRDAPEYPERQKVSKKPTGEISLDDIQRYVKRGAATNTGKTIGALVGLVSALGAASVGIIKAFSNETLFEYRLESAEKDIAKCQEDVERVSRRFERMRDRIPLPREHEEP